ncbi:MAG: sensor histidine kinase, partial [Cyanobacteria bacterium P01_A01_bin.40]
LCGDGSKRIIFANAAPIRNSQSKIIAAIATFYDVTQQKQAEAVKKDAENKSILLKEIHHRIKNNLQIVSALLDLQTEQIEDPRAEVLLEKSQARIHTMALIHEKLYSTKSLDRIDFAEYITSLCSFLHDSFIQDFKQIELIVEVEPTILSLDLATPCGLIINELVVNSLEHAFVAQSIGKIKVEFKKYAQNYYYLCIQDNGCGFNLELEKISSNTQFLGLSLVTSLVEKQLHGTWVVKQAQGFVIEITFPYI